MDEIVLVEDDDIIQGMLQTVLEFLLPITVVVRDGTSGTLEFVKARQPAIVLVGTETPGWAALVRDLKTDPATSNLPVVAVYSRGVVTRGDADDAGCDAFRDGGDIVALAATIQALLPRQSSGGDEPSKRSLRETSGLLVARAP